MVRPIHVLTFSISIFLVTSCSNQGSVEKSDDLGEHALEILKELEGDNTDDFKSHFLTASDLQEMSSTEDSRLSDDGKQLLKSAEQSDLTYKVDKGFFQIIEKGKKHKINWSEIKYKDFEYEVYIKEGIKWCEGSLIFSHGEEDFSVNIESIYTEDGYSLLSIDGVRKRH